MKRRWWFPVVAVLVVAVVVHLAVVAAAPRVVMSVAEGRIEDRAGGKHVWLHAERVTPQTQEVVRSSPDLAYSACVWDLSDGPVRISAPAWDDYFSLSLYDSRTDNFFVTGDRDSAADAADRVDLFLLTRDQLADLTDDQAVDLAETEGLRTVVAPSDAGVALLRYLAPTPSAFARADAVRRGAVCEPESP